MILVMSSICYNQHLLTRCVCRSIPGEVFITYPLDPVVLLTINVRLTSCSIVVRVRPNFLFAAYLKLKVILIQITHMHRIAKGVPLTIKSRISSVFRAS